MSEAALLAAVLAAPEDDAPRLVYADHLQANGDPRGELIAVQCDLARIAPSEDTEARKGNVIRRRRTDRAETLREREKELLRANRDTWIRPFAPSIDSNVDFERGFIERAFA